MQHKFSAHLVLNSTVPLALPEKTAFSNLTLLILGEIIFIGHFGIYKFTSNSSGSQRTSATTVSDIRFISRRKKKIIILTLLKNQPFHLINIEFKVT